MYNIINLFGGQSEITTLTGVTYKTFPLLELGRLNDIRLFLVKHKGIYAWYDFETKKIYVGSSNNLWHRFLSYKNFMFYGKTERINVKLRNHVKKHGFDQVKYFLLEVHDGDDISLRGLEQKFFDQCKPFGDNGFNIDENAYPHNYVPFTEEARKRISEAHSGENSARAKLTDEKVRAIKTALANGVKLVPLSKEFGVSTTVISNIKRGLTWDHVKIDEAGEQKLVEISERDKHKWTTEFIIAIKNDLNAGMTMKDVALKYEIGYSSVANLRNGYFHKNINP